MLRYRGSALRGTAFIEWSITLGICLSTMLLLSGTLTNYFGSHIRSAADMFLGSQKDGRHSAALASGGTQLTFPGDTYIVEGSTTRNENVSQMLQSFTTGAGSRHLSKQGTEISPGTPQSYNEFVLTVPDENVFVDKQAAPVYIPSQVNAQDALVQPPQRN